MARGPTRRISCRSAKLRFLAAPLEPLDSGDNQLERAVYNVTQDTGGAIDLSSLNWADYADDQNTVTCTDRVTYGRRVSGTRQRVNWYRGSPTRTSALPGTFDESNTAPTQKTHYDTSDDPGADPDNPASDGEGSRHNYTVIGQTSLTYDNNRNVLADGTREFRYSYNNQLRRVWRKSDGDAAGDGLLAKYREDAYGRRVYAESYWELSRRDVMDTRFSVDINMDEDGDSTELEYLDGGITSTNAAPMGFNDQCSAWDSRIRRDINNQNASHYFDFDVTVPEGSDKEGNPIYLGFIAYDTVELWIFSDRYELWDTTGPTQIGSQTMTTAGRHNIGIRAGDGYGVWIDGSLISSLTANGSIGLINQPKARFGTHLNESETALILWENLCYLRSYNRGVDPEESIPANGDPVVNVTNFDGPRPTVIHEVYDNATETPVCISTESGDRHDALEGGDPIETIELPHGRMHTGVVITQSKDLITYEDDGTRVDMSGDGDPMPGVMYDIHLAADGQIEVYGRFDPTALLETPWTAPTTSFDWTGQNQFGGISIQQGGGGEPEGDEPGGPDAGIPPSENPARQDIEQQSDSAFETDAEGECCARGVNVSDEEVSAGTIDQTIGINHDFVNGNGRDPHNGIWYSVGANQGPLLLGTMAEEEKSWFEKAADAVGGYLEDKVNEKVKEFEEHPIYTPLLYASGLYGAVKYVGEPVGTLIYEEFRDREALDRRVCKAIEEKTLGNWKAISTEEGRTKIVEELKNPTKETIHKIESITMDVITVVAIAVTVYGAYRVVATTLSNGRVVTTVESALKPSNAPKVGEVVDVQPITKPASAAAPNAKVPSPPSTTPATPALPEKSPLDGLKAQLYERAGKPKSASTVRAAQQEQAGGPKVCGKDHIIKTKQAQQGLKNYIQELKRGLGNPNLHPVLRRYLESELGEASKLLDRTEDFVK